MPWIASAFSADPGREGRSDTLGHDDPVFGSISPACGWPIDTAPY